jgi:hypothetical protein
MPRQKSAESLKDCEKWRERTCPIFDDDDGRRKRNYLCGAMTRSFSAAIVFLSRTSSSFTTGRGGLSSSATASIGHFHGHLRRHRPPAISHRLGGSIVMTSSITAAAGASPSPPIPRRDENRVVYAGIGPSLRQSNDSSELLMDPPMPISDPYGWMRDDDRTDGEILKYLTDENEYSKKVTEHLGGLQEDLYGEFLAG